MDSQTGTRRRVRLTFNCGRARSNPCTAATCPLSDVTLVSCASNQLPLQFIGQRAQLGEEMTTHRLVGHALAVNSDV
jgi:hypothetical protein